MVGSYLLCAVLWEISLKFGVFFFLENFPLDLFLGILTI